MARAPILQLSDISLTFGGNPLFAELDLTVQPGDRIALVGRNGSGKSTLMKVMAGTVEPDTGTRVLPPGLSVARLEQHPDLSAYATLGDYARAGLDPAEHWRVDMAAEGLKVQMDTACTAASGGERRRAALARLMAQDADLMLLDEPTNHLDIQAITWLEETLGNTQSAFVTISHDRAFLRALTRATLWVDRGQMRRLDKGFAHFEDWRDKTWAEEDLERHKLDRKIKHEAKWAVEGISARRKRNQGRVRALQDLRATRSAQIKRQGAAEMALDSAPKSGKRVVEAEAISKRYGDKVILKPVSMRIQRGERIALVGPNGAGKTTLLNMLIGRTEPDAGHVTLGTGLELAYFDQNRAALDPEQTLWETLAGDEGMRVSGQADQIMVRGQPRHVVGYLKEFLFTEAQARAPVRALSGGEKARLLLARLMAKPMNLLVMDEPTNDLDIETLDLLQELLDGLDGTILLVSHDRDFIDRVATSTVVVPGDGSATVYAGGWSDYLAQAGGTPAWTRAAQEPAPAKVKASAPKAEAAAPKPASGLSFTEKHRLEALPAEMAQLEAEIAKLEELMADPELYTREPVKFQKATEALSARQDKLAQAEDEWLLLEEKAGG